MYHFHSNLKLTDWAFPPPGILVIMAKGEYQEENWKRFLALPHKSTSPRVQAISTCTADMPLIVVQFMFKGGAGWSVCASFTIQL